MFIWVAYSDGARGLMIKKTENDDQKELSPAAVRALEEAEERRKQALEQKAAAEIGGRDGPDPVRFGDWEKAGIASDF